jgi:uncharacterized membrane protein YkoI
MARWCWLLSAALAASAISSVATVQAEEENKNEGPVPIDEIPAPAREAILREASGGILMEVHLETWQGGPVYEGHIRQGRRDVTIWVDAAGHVLHKH